MASVHNVYLYVFPNYSWFAVIHWFTVIYTPRAICECNFVMKMRLKSALNMPNLNGTLNLFAKHCVYILTRGGGGCRVGWYGGVRLIILLRWQLWQSSPKIWERENLATIISANRWSFRRRVIYIDEKCLKLKLKLKSLPLFTVTHRSSRRRSSSWSWSWSSCCQSLANCQVAVALWIMQREQVAGLPAVLGVDIPTTTAGQDVAAAAAAGWHPLT